MLGRQAASNQNFIKSLLTALSLSLLSQLAYAKALPEEKATYPMDVYIGVMPVDGEPDLLAIYYSPSDSILVNKNSFTESGLAKLDQRAVDDAGQTSKRITSLFNDVNKAYQNSGVAFETRDIYLVDVSNKALKKHYHNEDFEVSLDVKENKSELLQDFDKVTSKNTGAFKLLMADLSYDDGARGHAEELGNISVVHMATAMNPHARGQIVVRELGHNFGLRDNPNGDPFVHAMSQNEPNRRKKADLKRESQNQFTQTELAIIKQNKTHFQALKVNNDADSRLQQGLQQPIQLASHILDDDAEQHRQVLEQGLVTSPDAVEITSAQESAANTTRFIHSDAGLSTTTGLVATKQKPGKVGSDVVAPLKKKSYFGTKHEKAKSHAKKAKPVHKHLVSKAHITQPPQSVAEPVKYNPTMSDKAQATLFFADEEPAEVNYKRPATEYKPTDHEYVPRPNETLTVSYAAQVGELTRKRTFFPFHFETPIQVTRVFPFHRDHETARGDVVNLKLNLNGDSKPIRYFPKLTWGQVGFFTINVAYDDLRVAAKGGDVLIKSEGNDIAIMSPLPDTEGLVFSDAGIGHANISNFIFNEEYRERKVIVTTDIIQTDFKKMHFSTRVGGMYGYNKEKLQSNFTTFNGVEHVSHLSKLDTERYAFVAGAGIWLPFYDLFAFHVDGEYRFIKNDNVTKAYHTLAGLVDDEQFIKLNEEYYDHGFKLSTSISWAPTDRFAINASAKVETWSVPILRYPVADLGARIIPVEVNWADRFSWTVGVGAVYNI